MVTESISAFPGFFHVDSLTVAEFHDGFVNGASFFQIDENGNSDLYDVTYLIFKNGPTVEVLYYGDNFSAITFNDYAIMFESGYVGDTSKIPEVTESKLTSEIFTSSDLGFSFIPPKDWRELELNTEFQSESIPGTLNLVTSFSAPNFQGILGSDMVVMYLDLDRRVDLGGGGQDEDELMAELITGLQEGFGGTIST